MTWITDLARIRLGYLLLILTSALWMVCGRAVAATVSSDTGSRLASSMGGKAYFVRPDGALYVVDVNTDSQATQLGVASAFRTQPAMKEVTSIALGPALELMGTTKESKSIEVLYACDAGAGALYRVDLSTSATGVAQATPILVNDLLKERCLVAVSDAGVVAVAGTQSHLFLTLTERGHSIVARKTVQGLETPTQLAFAGEELLVLQDYRVFSVHSGGDEPTSEKMYLRPVERVAPEQAHIRRVVTDRGIVYSFSQDATFVLSYADSKSVGIAFPFVYDLPSTHAQGETLRSAIQDRAQISRANEIAVKGDNLLLLDAAGGYLVSIPRLVPAVINLEGPATQASDALRKIYGYLYSAGLLPTQTVTASRDYDSMRQWLLELQVVLPLGLTSHDAKKSVDLIEADLGRLICVLNSTRCLDGAILSLSSRVHIGSVMTLPLIRKRPHTVVRLRDLNGATLEDVIAQSSPSAAYSSWYLADLNESVLPSFDATLNRERYLMLTPFSEAFQLGSVVRNIRGVEHLVADRGHCFSADTVRLPEALPGVVNTTAGIQVLPRDLSGQQSDHSTRPDVDSIEIKFDNPVSERLATDILTPRDAECLSRDPLPPSNDPVFVVTSVLTVSGMRYRLLNKKHHVLHPTPSQLRTWGLAGMPDSSKKWSVLVDKAYAIAYQASAPLLEAAPIRWHDLTDPSLLKRGSSQDVKSRTEGKFLIPVENWQIDVLLPPRELRTDDSVLSRFTAHVPGVYVLPVTGFTAMAQGSIAVQPAEPGLTIASVKENRSAVLNNIHWPIGRPIFQRLADKRVTLAVAESDADTTSWRWHPQFIESDGVTNIWRESVKDVGLIPLTKPPHLTVDNNGTYSVSAAQITEHDHGVYVAGLLAGRNKDVPGLLPNVSLLLINLAQTSINRLDTIIDDANTNNISVVNFSQIIPVTEKDTGLVQLKKKIRKEWTNRLLFVAAAGNNEGHDSGENVADLPGQLALIAWARDLPQNIVGVAASDPGDDHVIKKCKPDPGDNAQRACSNFGKKFVQLTAPGYRVYGIGAGNEYLLGSGTSVAAPQVAAAAALLKTVGPIGLTPNKIKARLIYTADYEEDYITDSSVWGGRLNVERAISQPAEYLIQTNSSINSKLFRVDIDLDWMLEGVNTGDLYDPVIEHGSRPSALRVNQLLRMHYTENGFWIVYIEKESPWTMRMIVHANPSKDKRIPCNHVWEWNDHAQEFTEITDHDWIKNGIPLDDVLDLIGPIPDSVELPE